MATAVGERSAQAGPAAVLQNAAHSRSESHSCARVVLRVFLNYSYCVYRKRVTNILRVFFEIFCYSCGCQCYHFIVVVVVVAAAAAAAADDEDDGVCFVFVSLLLLLLLFMFLFCMFFFVVVVLGSLLVCMLARSLARLLACLLASLVWFRLVWFSPFFCFIWFGFG